MLTYETAAVAVAAFMLGFGSAWMLFEQLKQVRHDARGEDHRKVTMMETQTTMALAMTKMAEAMTKMAETFDRMRRH